MSHAASAMIAAAVTKTMLLATRTQASIYVKDAMYKLIEFLGQLFIILFLLSLIGMLVTLLGWCLLELGRHLPWELRRKEKRDA